MRRPGHKAATGIAEAPPASPTTEKADRRPGSREDNARLARLRAEIDKGEADMAAGRFATLADDEQIEAFFARLQAEA